MNLYNMMTDEMRADCIDHGVITRKELARTWGGSVETILIDRLLETVDEIKKTLEEMRFAPGELISNFERRCKQLGIESTDPELKPCPFCPGGKGELFDKPNYSIRCNSCGVETEWFLYKLEAIEAWNRRV